MTWPLLCDTGRLRDAAVRVLPQEFDATDIALMLLHTPGPPCGALTAVTNPG